MPPLRPPKSRVVFGAMKRAGKAATAVAPNATQIASVPLLITVTIASLRRPAVASVPYVVACDVPLDVTSSVTA